MITKNEMKYYSSLLQKKARRKENKFIVEGKKSLFEALKSSYEADKIFYTDSFYEQEQEFVNHLISHNIKVEEITIHDIGKLTDTETPQGIVGIFHQKDLNWNCCDNNKFLVNNRTVLYLESVSDPGNLGTIIRTADWFGISEIFLNSGTVELYSPKVVRSTVGSIFHINFYEITDEFSFISEMKKNGFSVVITDIHGESIFSHIKKEHTILCLHNESHGPSSFIKESADCTVTIPRKGKAESLNVASAASIIISEFSK